MSKNQGLIYKHKSLQKTFQVHKKNYDNEIETVCKWILVQHMMLYMSLVFK